LNCHHLRLDDESLSISSSETFVLLTTASADHVDIEGLNLALVTLNMMYPELSCSKMAYAEDDVDKFPWHLAMFSPPTPVAWSSPTL
jgi:hypothetical protein